MLTRYALPIGLTALFAFVAPANATLTDAINSGDPALLSDVTEAEIVTATINQITSYQNRQIKLLSSTYGTAAINYVPGYYNQLINITENETVFPLLAGNGGNLLAVDGTAGGGRFVAYSSSPVKFFSVSSNLDYEQPFMRVLGWLMTGTPGDTSALTLTKKVALTYTGSYNTAITSWLAQKTGSKWTTQLCNDPATISTCYQNQDLLILSLENGSNTAANDAAVLAAIKAHLKLGKPVLYMHNNTWGTSSFSDAVSAFLGFSFPYGGNFWADDQASFSGWSVMNQQQDTFAQIKRLLLHFKNQDFVIDWSLCSDDRSCKSIPALVSEFYNGAEAVKQQVSAWESKSLDIFTQGGRRLGKLLVLLGDKYRAAINYPMQKGVIDNTTFLKALYADHSVYIARKINPPQADLGSFSGTIANTTPTTAATLTLPTKTSAISSTTGYYAVPGQTLTLTRKDSAAVNAYVHVNMLRSGAAHVFATYDRPMFLWSTKIPLTKGKAVNVTSPYGGIIFLSTEGSATPQTVTVAANNVAREAIFTGANLAEFTSQLASTPFNWADIKLPALEIHSRMDLMRQSISDPLIGGDLNRLVTLTQNYLYKDTYGLAGMVGAGLTQPQKVLDFCTAHGWNCTDPLLHGMSNIQHINADQANCGYGCSGNPYDQYWAYTPLGWGESHEIGHNLQRGRLKIYDGASTEVSNNIFPTHKWWRFNKSTTETVKYGRSLGFKATFDALQQAVKTANPVESARQAIWVNGGVFQRLIFYWQMAMSSKNLPQLGDSGWDLFRLMYLHERLFTQAIGNDSNWANQRAGLGFTQYSLRTDASAISSNDFMLISMSYITGRDQRPFFDMWGIAYSAAASAQVAQYGFPAAAKKFWVVPQEDLAFKDPLPTAVAIDGKSLWPL